MQQGTVSSADRLSQGVIAWLQVQTLRKEEKHAEKFGACDGLGDPRALVDSAVKQRTSVPSIQSSTHIHTLSVCRYVHAIGRRRLGTLFLSASEAHLYQPTLSFAPDATEGSTLTFPWGRVLASSLEGRQRPNLKSEDSGLRACFSEAKVSLWMCENGAGHEESRGPTRR